MKKIVLLEEIICHSIFLQSVSASLQEEEVERLSARLNNDNQVFSAIEDLDRFSSRSPAILQPFVEQLIRIAHSKQLYPHTLQLAHSLLVRFVQYSPASSSDWIITKLMKGKTKHFQEAFSDFFIYSFGLKKAMLEYIFDCGGAKVLQDTFAKMIK